MFRLTPHEQVRLPSDKLVGAYARAARHTLGLSIRALAMRLGFTEAMVRKVESKRVATAGYSDPILAVLFGERAFQAALGELVDVSKPATKKRG